MGTRGRLGGSSAPGIMGPVDILGLRWDRWPEGEGGGCRGEALEG